MQVPSNGFNLPSKSSYEPKKLNETHRAIMRLLLQGNMTQKAIAKKLGITEQMVSYTKKSAIFQEQMAIMQAVLDSEAIETQQLIHDLQAPAALKLGKTMLTTTDDKLAVDIAKDLLNRGGHKGVDVHLHTTLTVEQIHEIREKGKKKSREIVDATIIEDDE